MSATVTDNKQAIRDWARAEADKLEPLSDADARAVGRIARVLDAVIAERAAAQR